MFVLIPPLSSTTWPVYSAFLVQQAIPVQPCHTVPHPFPLPLSLSAMLSRGFRHVTEAVELLQPGLWELSEREDVTQMCLLAAS